MCIKSSSDGTTQTHIMTLKGKVTAKLILPELVDRIAAYALRDNFR